MQQINLKIGNVLEKIKLIPDNSIDCIVTSCPYYGLRKYKAPDVVWGGNPACEHEFINSTDSKLLHENRNGLGQNSTVSDNPFVGSGFKAHRDNRAQEQGIQGGTPIYRKPQSAGAQG